MNVASLILKLFNNIYFISFLAAMTCAFYYYLKSDLKYQKKVVRIVYSFLFLGILAIFLKGEIYRINQPRVWDFTAFFVYGKVAAAGYNFYLPENFHTVFNTLNLPFQNSELTDFIESLVNVGFPYPPPTMLYFLLLGYLTYSNALFLWSVLIVLVLFYDIYLAYKHFFIANKINGLLLVSILFLIYPMVKFNNICSQTNGLVLLYLFLMKRYSESKFAGILLALAFFTKPFMLILGLYFLLTKKWKPIIYFIASASILSGISILTFGFDTFISYFLNNSAQRIPAWQFSEDVNQSLHAVLLRANLISLDKPHIYLFISAVLIITTIVFSRLLIKKKLDNYVWALLLLVGLLVYPGTLSYYGVVLLFIVFQFFNKEETLGLDYRICIPVIGILFYLGFISVFASICFLLAVVLIKSIYDIKKLNSLELVFQN
jgi:hypothetical protein